MYTWVVTVVPKHIEEVAYEDRPTRRTWRAYHPFHRSSQPEWSWEQSDLSRLEVSFFNHEEHAMLHAEHLAQHHPNKNVLVSKTTAVATSKVAAPSISLVTDKGVIPR